MNNNNIQVATLGGGCFWCTEAVFQEVKGIEKVISGYAGGNVPGEPTYREICSGLTGHAEVIEITYDEHILSYEDIVVIFMTTHDPTTLNSQGPDFGTQYRSEIFYLSDRQKEIAESAIKKANLKLSGNVVTKFSLLKNYCPAEEYHQRYLEKR